MKKILFSLALSVFAYANINLNDIKADFKQTIFKDKASIVYTGELFFKDNKNLWIYKTPAEKKVYLNDDLVVIVEDELEQVIVQRLKDKINITNILKNATLKKDNHYEAKYQDIIYDIFIKDDKNIIISYKDIDKNKVLLELYNTQKNQNLQNSIFIPTYPSTYDEVKQ